MPVSNEVHVVVIPLNAMRLRDIINSLGVKRDGLFTHVLDILVSFTVRAGLESNFQTQMETMLREIIGIVPEILELVGGPTPEQDLLTMLDFATFELSMTLVERRLFIPGIMVSNVIGGNMILHHIHSSPDITANGLMN